MAIRGDGKSGQPGWPDSPGLEALREAWLNAVDLDAERADRPADATADVAGCAVYPAWALGSVYCAPKQHRRSAVGISGVLWGAQSLRRGLVMGTAMKMIRPALREYRTWSVDSRRWEIYEPRIGDIIIATAPKCGTTWMQQIVSSLVFQDAERRALTVVSPSIDARFRGPAAEVHQILAAQTHRRFPKTHLPVDGLPLYDECSHSCGARRTGRGHVDAQSFHRILRCPVEQLRSPRLGRPDNRQAVSAIAGRSG